MSQFGRNEILDYARRRFGTEPDYPFEKYPRYVALRVAGTGKWFALVMDVPRNRLGLEGEGRVDILDVKCPPATIATLRTRDGFLPAYHMDKNHWITVRLDGSVPEAEITRLLDTSHQLVE